MSSMAMKPALLSETSASNMTWEKREEVQLLPSAFLSLAHSRESHLRSGCGFQERPVHKYKHLQYKRTQTHRNVHNLHKQNSGSISNA